MIVIGVDVHKQSVTAVAVGEAGRMLDEQTVVVGSDELIGWASTLAAERLWALEDYRQLTRWLEQQLVGQGEDLVRVPPKLMAPQRRAGRTRGKSDAAPAIAEPPRASATSAATPASTFFALVPIRVVLSVVRGSSRVLPACPPVLRRSLGGHKNPL